MASKKLKRAAKVAAGIGAAYLASQALSKKKPTPAEAKGLKIARSKKFGESDEGQIARLDAAQQRGLDIARSKPFEMSDEATRSPVYGSPVDESNYMSQNEGFGPMAKEGKFISKKMKSGGSVIARGNRLFKVKPTKLF